MRDCQCDDLSGWVLVNYVLYCHILWWLFYGFLILMTKQKEEWCCRLLTFVHGCLISYSTIEDIICNKTSVDFIEVPLSRDKKYFLSYMLSYFLFDYFWIRLFGNESWIIHVHHCVSIGVITSVLLTNYACGAVTYCAAGLELTNPYLQLRWFLRTHGLQHTLLHKVVELWFMLMFFVIRMIGGTMLLYWALVKEKTTLTIKLYVVSLYGISLLIQWQILSFFKKKYVFRRFNVVSSIASMLHFRRRRPV